jgi:oxygen-independent coproporphyrinogen-3 oxidase
MENILQSAGIYIHIPYCKRKCSYCNFHFSTNLSTRENLLKALNQEISQRAVEGNSLNIQSIYFGGGTPSVLIIPELINLIQNLRKHYRILESAEVTMECNPDDLNDDYLKELKEIGINRISIGVQSFYDNQLQWMNRAHNASQSHQSIESVIKSGFDNFSVDLMYGLPDSDHKIWSDNLQNLLQYKTPHFSCYALTVEERTALHQMTLTKTLTLPEDGFTMDQMDALLDFCEQHQYEAYEISNFARPGFRSLHNSSYWKGIPYLGFGPSSHSYMDHMRRANISNNQLYIHALTMDLPYYELEKLSPKDQCNEFIMLQLRRMEGILFEDLELHFKQFAPQIKIQLEREIEKKNILLYKDRYIFSRQGKHLADEVSAQLFV